MNQRIKEFIKYCLISIFCTFILYVVFYVVDKVTNGNYILANFFSYFISFLILYILNERLFKVKKDKDRINRLILFVIVRAIGFPIDSLVLGYIIRNFNFSNIISKVICSIIMFIYNYLTNKYIIFKKYD